MVTGNALTPRQQKFVNAYLVNPIGSQAAITAGYSAIAARNAAARLLAKANVANAVQQGLDRASRSLDISVQWIAEAIRDIASDPNANNGDKLRALELLGKWRRMFVEQVETHTTHDITPLAEFTIEELKALRATTKVIPSTVKGA